MNSVDKYLSYKFKPNEFTCSDFARLIWLDLTGKDIAVALQGLLQAHDGRGLRREHVRFFRELAAPISPCLVVMQKPRAPVHIGVYLRGNVLHLPESGPEFQPPYVAARAHSSFRFITCNV